MIKKLTKLTKTLLVAAGLCVGASNVWADGVDIWDFSSTTAWGNETSDGKSANYKELATGSEVWFAPDGSSATSATSNVSFKFKLNGAKFNYGGINKLGISSTGNYDSENDINYVKVVIPVGYRVIVDMSIGSEGRPMHIKKGESVTTYTANTRYVYDNTTSSEETILVYATNGAGGDYKNHHINSITLVNKATAPKYGWTANAVATIDGTPTTIKTYSSAANWILEDQYTVNVDKAILYNGSYYQLNDAAFSANTYGVTYIMGATAGNHNFTYEKIENCVFYGEAENICTAQSNSTTESNNSKLSNGGGKYIYTNGSGYVTLTFNVEKAGFYDIKLGLNNTNGKSRGFNYQIDGGTESPTINVSANTAQVQDINDMYLTAGNHTIKLNLTYSLTPIFDYVLVTSDYVFTEVVGNTDKTSADRSVKSSDIVLKKGDVYNVKFCNYGSDAENKNNFIVLINNAASMYADWYDYLQGKGGWDNDSRFRNADLSVKDPYQASTDGGSTSGNLDWANYSGITKSFVDLTIKYKDGKVTIEGSATSIDNPNNIYYYGYAYTVADAEADATVNLSVCLSWLGIVSVDQTYVGATISDAKYASFSSTKALDFSAVEGLTAFIATGSDDNNVTLEEVDDAKAGTGLVLKGDVLKGDTKTYSIPVIASGHDHSATNKLWAITSDDTVEAAGEGYTNYVLALQDNKVVFAPVTGSNTASVEAGHAALCLQTGGTGTGARALSISFDDEATGINTVESNTSIENDAIYNLRGQRVSQPTKGLYIVGGKKVMVK